MGRLPRRGQSPEWSARPGRSTGRQYRPGIEQQNQQRPVTERLLPAAVLLKAVIRALREVPELNGTFEASRDGRWTTIRLVVPPAAARL